VPSTQAAVADAVSFMTDLKVFIVEDSPVIRENLVGALEELAPIQVVGTAEDENSAVRWLSSRENTCDLVIVDIFLRGGSGLGVLRSAMSLHKPMQLVVLSNYATPDMRRKCLELGAARVFDKSNEIDALILYCTRLQSGETGAGELGGTSL
jgi:DNA-binding NarL/FixJ family response regulator